MKSVAIARPAGKAAPFRVVGGYGDAGPEAPRAALTRLVEVGALIVVEAWTSAQWAALPLHERPPLAARVPAADCWVLARPARSHREIADLGGDRSDS